MSSYIGPDLFTKGMMLHLDAGDKNSYPGSGTIWYDNSGFGRTHTVFGAPANSVVGGFTLDSSGNQFFNISSSITPVTTATVVTVFKTTDNTFLWFRGSSNDGIYLGATSGGGALYNSSVGVPTYYVDTATTLNPLLDGNWHMWEAKNVNLSGVTQFEWFHYPSGFAMQGSVALILIYDHALTLLESQQNYSALKQRFGFS